MGDDGTGQLQHGLSVMIFSNPVQRQEFTKPWIRNGPEYTETGRTRWGCFWRLFLIYNVFTTILVRERYVDGTYLLIPLAHRFE